jgi:hypothetical protein
MDEITKNTLIPKELADILETKIYAAYSRGAPIETAIREGIKLFNDYWREKFADKSGG